MADYYTHAVVHQVIPERLMSPLERLLLTAVFDFDTVDDGLYFYAENSPHCDITLSRRNVEEALAATRVRSRLRLFIASCLGKANSEHDAFDVDLSAFQTGDVPVVALQDIVRRAKGELPYVSIAYAYTCNKMRPDGFGGMGVIITPARVLYQSTYDFFENFERRRLRRAQAEAALP
jgi:hypothetical protein